MFADLTPFSAETEPALNTANHAPLLTPCGALHMRACWCQKLPPAALQTQKSIAWRNCTTPQARLAVTVCPATHLVQ